MQAFDPDFCATLTELLTWRRDVRHFRTDPLDEAMVLELLTLAQLAPINRAVLTLRYVDDLPVADCARILDRTVGATEALLTRAKRAFREAYPLNQSAKG